MANRKLNPMRSTLPGPSGKPSKESEMAEAIRSADASMRGFSEAVSDTGNAIGDWLSKLEAQWRRDIKAHDIELLLGPAIDDAWNMNRAFNMTAGTDVEISYALVDGAL